MDLQTLVAKLPIVNGWIDKILSDYSSQSRSVSELGFARLPQFYSANLLARTKIIPVAKVPVPPLSQMGLSDFAAFEAGNYAGITYKDTYFVQTTQVANESLHFHELVHVIQWAYLGVEKFLLSYASGLAMYGYKDSPLEAMAYGFQAYFDSCSSPKDIEGAVRSKLNELNY